MDFILLCAALIGGVISLLAILASFGQMIVAYSYSEDIRDLLWGAPLFILGVVLGVGPFLYFYNHFTFTW